MAPAKTGTAPQVALARSQLKAVFGKTGVSRQAKLVALLARMSAGGWPSPSA